MSERPLFIVNPASGSGRTARIFGEIRQITERALGPIDVVFTERPRHATELARDAARSGRRRIVAVGGDGTFSEVAAGVVEAGSDAAVGLVHQGTGGDFRRSLGLEHRLDRYLEAIARDAPRAVDVGVAAFVDRAGRPAERVFVNVASFGLGGLVDRYVEEGTRLAGGKATYLAASVRALAAGRAARLACEVELDGERRTERFTSRLVAVCNGRYFGGGMQVAPPALLDDGALDMVALEGEGRLSAMRAMAAVYGGTHLDLGNVRHFRASRIRMAIEGRPDDRFLVDLDGEWAGSGPLALKVRRRALRVFC